MSNKASEMRDLVYAAAGPRERFENKKRCLDRAAYHAGLTYRMVRAVFYGEIQDDDHKAIRALRVAARKQNSSFADLLERQAESMERADADMFGAAAAAMLDVARALRHLAGSRDGR